MATQAYMQGRKKYGRPQAMLWADNPGTYQNGFYIPNGHERGSEIYNNGLTAESFIILSDDNRQAVDFKPERIEQRKRMVNGRMRSYHVADKLTISTSWSMLPSRSFTTSADFGVNGKPTSLDTEGNIVLTQYMDVDNNGKTDVITTTRPAPIRPFGSAINKDQQYTSDGGAGGVEMLRWYEENPGSFWVYLAYDNYKNFEELQDETPYDNLAKYNQIVEVFFSDFSYTVEKRGGSNYDFWNISVSLEEV